MKLANINEEFRLVFFISNQIYKKFLQNEIRIAVIAKFRVDKTAPMISVLTAGATKSITTIKSSMMQMKIVQNDGRMKVIDLKTGKALPAQNMPQQNPTDISKPTIFYSAKQKRVVKMDAVVNGANSESRFEYCDNTCDLPGMLRKVSISTKLPTGAESIVTVEVTAAKQRHILPPKMFNID